MICNGPGPRAWGRAAGSEARAAQRGRTGTSSPPCTARTEQITLHSEAIWGVMIALVFYAIFEPHDENKS